MAELITLAQAHARAHARLAGGGIVEPGTDARLLVEHLTGTNRTDALVRPDMPISAQTLARLDTALSRRLAREPVHRILGFRDFHGLTLKLSPDTLEPRDDTETLVAAGIVLAKAAVGRKGGCRLLDLGTGTGAVALAVMSAVPSCHALATDISQDALATARANADIHGLADRFATLWSDWYSSVSGRFDIIISNPPYIPTGDVGELEPEVRLFDPMKALDGGSDGLDCYRIIAAGARDHLSADGRVAVEIGHDQKTAVEAVFAQAGLGIVEIRHDLAGHQRVLIFRMA